MRKDHFKIDVLDGEGQVKVGQSPAEKKALETLQKRIGIGLRGSANGRYGVIKEGMMMYSALPHKYVAPRSWQGPSPNMKMVIKNEYPRTGDFVFRVEAARGWTMPTKEGLISLREKVPLEVSTDTIVLVATNCSGKKNLVVNEDGVLIPKDVASQASADFKLQLENSGYYQIDFVHPYAQKIRCLRLCLP